MYFICSGSKRFHLGLSGEFWLLPWCVASCWADAGGCCAEGNALNHLLTCIRAEGVFCCSSSLSGLPPRYVVGCVVLADTDLSQTSRPLCLLYLRSCSGAAFHCIFLLGEIWGVVCHSSVLTGRLTPSRVHWDFRRNKRSLMSVAWHQADQLLLFPASG